MTPVQTAQLAMTAARKELSAHLSIIEEQRSVEWLSELETKTQKVTSRDAEMAAATLVEPEPVEERSEETGETREYSDLRSKVSFGDYITGCRRNEKCRRGCARTTTSTLASLATHSHLAYWARLRTRAKRDGDATASQGTWLDKVFSDSAGCLPWRDLLASSSGCGCFPRYQCGWNTRSAWAHRSGK